MQDISPKGEPSEEDKKNILTLITREYEEICIKIRENARGLFTLLGIGATLASGTFAAAFTFWKEAIVSVFVFNIAFPLIFW